LWRVAREMSYQSALHLENPDPPVCSPWGSIFDALRIAFPPHMLSELSRRTLRRQSPTSTCVLTLPIDRVSPFKPCASGLFHLFSSPLLCFFAQAMNPTRVRFFVFGWVSALERQRLLSCTLPSATFWKLYACPPHVLTCLPSLPPIRSSLLLLVSLERLHLWV